MNWLNLPVDVFKAPEVTGSRPEDVGTWIIVLGWCALVENGGLIEGAGRWNNLMWLKTCGVSREHVRRASLLLVPIGEDFHALFYPGYQERAVQAGREGGKKGGRPKKTRNPPDNHQVSVPDNPPGNPNGMEWNGKEWNERETARTRGASPAPVAEEEAWDYAKNLTVAPAFTRQMVGHWWSDRNFRGWETSGDNPRPITSENWRDDLRRSHRWAQEARALTKDGPVSGPAGSVKKIKPPPDAAESAWLDAARGLWPDMAADTRKADIPVSRQRRVDEVLAEKKEIAAA